MHSHGFTNRALAVPAIIAVLTSGMLGMILSDIPLTSAADIELTHDAGNLTFKVDDHATLPVCIEHNGIQQTDGENGWLDETFFFFDQSQYIHTGSGDIATGRSTFPGGDPPEFSTTSWDLPLAMMEDGVVDRSCGSFTKVKDINGQVNDIRVDQTAWNKKNENWGLFRWTLENLQNFDLTAVRFGLSFHACVGGDNGDDKAFWNSTHNVYYIKDAGSSTYLGFASADPGVPINMYWDGPINEFYWDKDLYDAAVASPHVSGFYNDLASIVGWTDDEVGNSGLTIPANEFVTRTLVMAVNTSYEDLLETIEQARHFYKPRTLMISEIADEGVPRVEIHTLSSVPVDLWNVSLSVDGGQTYWSGGSWDAEYIPGDGYSVWTLAGTDDFNSTQGAVLGLYNISTGEKYDEVAFGNRGRAPDPIDDPNIGSISRILTSGWVHSLSGMTFGSKNTGTGSVEARPEIVLNEVMFNPKSPKYGFIEIMYTGHDSVDIDGYTLVTDGIYRIPESHIIEADDPYFVVFRNHAPGLFAPCNLSPAADNVYLYDSDGTLLDMVGWSTEHTQNRTVTRAPEGEGTHEGYDDISSGLAGWVFDSHPTLPRVHLGPGGQVKYCDPGDSAWFNMTLKSKMETGELFELFEQTPPGWLLEIYLDDMTTQVTDSDGDGIPDMYLGAQSSVDLSVSITLPTSGIYGCYGNSTVTAQGNSDPAIWYTNKFEIRLNPYLCPGKTVTPSRFNVLGTGFDEVATISLSVTGCGFGIASTMPQDVVFVVDRSDSMLPEDIELAKQAITEYVENMSSPDRGAAEHFDSNVVLMSALTGNYNKLKNDIKNIPGPGDLTYMGEALLEALEELNTNGKSEHSQNIILLTDGGWNGNIDPMDVAYWAAENSTRIFAIGLGNGPYNELLKDIADVTGGQNFTAETAEDLRGIYIHIATIIDRIAGRDKDTSDSDPMVRDVLPPWIDYIPGSFSLEPDHVQVNATGYTVLEWNISSILIAENWTVSFSITCDICGFVEGNNYTASRISYTDWKDTPVETLFPKTMINVIVPAPEPPALSIEIVDDYGFRTGRGDHVRLSWTPPPTPATSYYLIYRSASRTAFDFTAPWVRTDVDYDNGVDPLRTSWNDSHAAGGGQKNAHQTLFYAIRAVNSAGKTSTTSRTVGKWTRTFHCGTSSFSLPLAPLWAISSFSLSCDMGAQVLRYMDPADHVWRDQGNGFMNGTVLKLGRGYEVEFSSSTRYTFCGLPGAMLRYGRFGFSANPWSGDADSLRARVDDTSDSVVLSWTQPSGMTPDYRFHVLRSCKRDGFWGVQDHDYSLLAVLDHDILTYEDYGIISGGAGTFDSEFYYMVVPVNASTGEWGTGTYSIGVRTVGYGAGYDTMALPLVPDVDRTVDWYCHNIPNNVGINYYLSSENRWAWHSRRMPQGAYDLLVEMGEGYQISTNDATKFTFIGV